MIFVVISTSCSLCIQPLPNIPTLSLPSSVADTSTIVGAADGDSLTSGALPSLRWIVAEPPSDITSTYSQAESVRKQAELAMKSLQGTKAVRRVLLPDCTFGCCWFFLLFLLYIG